RFCITLPLPARPTPFPYTTLFRSPGVRLGRIQNFGSWSPYLVKEGRTCLGLEYFVFEGDDLWTMADADLVDLGRRELATLGLVRSEEHTSELQSRVDLVCRLLLEK